MCFTPTISLTTAIIEFLVATYLLVKYKNYLIPAFSAIFIYILGAYQFTEFMLCTSENPFLWAKAGFMIYTLLPVIALHTTLRLVKRKFPNYLIYIPSAIFILIATLKQNFIVQASCQKIFVLVKVSPLIENFFFLREIYFIYYFGYILISIILLLKYVTKTTEIIKKHLAYLGVLVGTITILAPILLIVLLPQLKIQFPSIYCEFAILFSITALIASEIYSRKRKGKEKI
jgi:hypothetical protein